MDREALEETLADARRYARADAADALHAALDMLLDDAPGLMGDSQLGASTLEVIDSCRARFLELGDRAGAERSLDVYFDLAGPFIPGYAELGADASGIYRRALLASASSAVPAQRLTRHANLQALFGRTASLAGGVVECGCARGLSFLQMAYLQAGRDPAWRGEGFMIFDSFEGLSEPGSIDHDFAGMAVGEAERVRGMTQAGKFAFAFDDVSQRVWREFPAVRLFKGWIPERFAEVADEHFRFVHVDVDLYEPTLASFEFFYPRLVPGGIIATDDYNWPGGRRAVDEFCAAHGLTAHTTATSQAYLIAP
ncbi:MAG TPA: TylF/MycF/NovP-related O-methyltransferase [Nevskiaceae bacterium]|nr:TylF/MycF/NovP-related O-methyltransferase [Nevskiaceae bacterium]